MLSDPWRITASRMAITFVMLSAIALVFVDSVSLTVAAATVLLGYLCLGWRQFGTGTWVPVALSVAVGAMAIWRGLPMPAFLDAAGRMIFLGSLIPILNLLRTAAAVAPEVALAGRFLTEQPASRRYIALSLGGHLFGVLINFGGLALLLDLSTRSMQNAQTDRLPPALKEVKLKRMTLAVMRGFGLISLWSPFGFATNVVLITIPGISYAQFGLIGFAMSFVFLGIGWAIDRIEGGPYRKMALAGAQLVPPRGAWIGAAMLIGHALALGALVLAVHHVTVLSFQQALITLVPVYAVAWIAMSGRVTTNGAAAMLRVAAGIAWRRQSTAAGEVGVFAAAGFLPVVLLSLLPIGALQVGIAGLEFHAVVLALALMFAIVVLALVGVNPIVSASVLGAIAAQLSVPGLSLTAIALAITGGWSVVIGLSPFITTVVFCATIIDRPVWKVGPVWNGLYCLAITLTWAALLTTLMISGAI